MEVCGPHWGHLGGPHAVSCVSGRCRGGLTRRNVKRTRGLPMPPAGGAAFGAHFQPCRTLPVLPQGQSGPAVNRPREQQRAAAPPAGDNAAGLDLTVADSEPQNLLLRGLDVIDFLGEPGNPAPVRFPAGRQR